MISYPKTLMLLGSGELGKEFAIAAKRLGCTIIACDRYENAPAMQVSDIAEVFNMGDEKILKKTILKHNPDLVIPEIEALAINALIEVEKEGIKVIPNARATEITMNRDKIRNLASKDLKIKTANFDYASSLEELEKKILSFQFPVLIKPVMSSSGKGQSLVKQQEEIEESWKKAIKDSRGTSTKIIIEEFIDFDFEITLLTIRENDGSILFCPPIGHEQSNGDYQLSWQPAIMTNEHLEKAKSMAKIIINNLRGQGIFGIEFFIKGDEVIFSELSPRPHDTGLVTLISQNINEFELHLRAVLGLPIHEVISAKAAASKVILASEDCENVCYKGLKQAMSKVNSKILLFGKPNAKKGRRMGVVLSLGEDLEEAINLAKEVALSIQVKNKTI